jgi:hypothetical protein
MTAISLQVFTFCNHRFIYTARVTLLSLCVLFVNACASQAVDGPVNSAEGLQIKGLIIENQSLMWVTAARLLVPATGNFVSCGNITPNSRCATTFPETDYSGNPVQITWSQGGQIHSTGDYKLELPEDIDITKPAMVRVIITAPGSAGAIITQD